MWKDGTANPVNFKKLREGVDRCLETVYLLFSNTIMH